MRAPRVAVVLACWLRIWRPRLERQAAGRRLIRYDPRGTGLSDRDVDFRGLTVEALADDLEATEAMLLMIRTGWGGGAIARSCGR